MDRRRLPIGIRNFRELREANAYYVRFDLSPIRQRFRAAYGHDTGTVQLHLHPAPDAGGSLIYRF